MIPWPLLLLVTIISTILLNSTSPMQCNTDGSMMPIELTPDLALMAGDSITLRISVNGNVGYIQPEIANEVDYDDCSEIPLILSAEPNELTDFIVVPVAVVDVAAMEAVLNATSVPKDPHKPTILLSTIHLVHSSSGRLLGTTNCNSGTFSNCIANRPVLIPTTLENPCIKTVQDFDTIWDLHLHNLSEDDLHAAHEGYMPSEADMSQIDDDHTTTSDSPRPFVVDPSDSYTPQYSSIGIVSPANGFTSFKTMSNEDKSNPQNPNPPKQSDMSYMNYYYQQLHNDDLNAAVETVENPHDGRENEEFVDSVESLTPKPRSKPTASTSTRPASQQEQDAAYSTISTNGPRAKPSNKWKSQQQRFMQAVSAVQRRKVRKRGEQSPAEVLDDLKHSETQNVVERVEPQTDGHNTSHRWPNLPSSDRIFVITALSIAGNAQNNTSNPSLSVQQNNHFTSIGFNSLLSNSNQSTPLTPHLNLIDTIDGLYYPSTSLINRRFLIPLHLKGQTATFLASLYRITAHMKLTHLTAQLQDDQQNVRQSFSNAVESLIPLHDQDELWLAHTAVFLSEMLYTTLLRHVNSTLPINSPPKEPPPSILTSISRFFSSNPPTTPDSGDSPQQTPDELLLKQIGIEIDEYSKLFESILLEELLYAQTLPSSPLPPDSLHTTVHLSADQAKAIRNDNLYNISAPQLLLFFTDLLLSYSSPILHHFSSSTSSLNPQTTPMQTYCTTVQRYFTFLNTTNPLPPLQFEPNLDKKRRYIEEIIPYFTHLLQYSREAMLVEELTTFARNSPELFPASLNPSLITATTARFSHQQPPPHLFSTLYSPNFGSKTASQSPTPSLPSEHASISSNAIKAPHKPTQPASHPFSTLQSTAITPVSAQPTGMPQFGNIGDILMDNNGLVGLFTNILNGQQAEITGVSNQRPTLGQIAVNSQEQSNAVLANIDLATQNQGGIGSVNDQILMNDQKTRFSQQQQAVLSSLLSNNPALNTNFGSRVGQSRAANATATTATTATTSSTSKLASNPHLTAFVSLKTRPISLKTNETQVLYSPCRGYVDKFQHFDDISELIQTQSSSSITSPTLTDSTTNQTVVQSTLPEIESSLLHRYDDDLAQLYARYASLYSTPPLDTEDLADTNPIEIYDSIVRQIAKPATGSPSSRTSFTLSFRSNSRTSAATIFSLPGKQSQSVSNRLSERKDTNQSQLYQDPKFVTTTASSDPTPSPSEFNDLVQEFLDSLPIPNPETPKGSIPPDFSHLPSWLLDPNAGPRDPGLPPLTEAQEKFKEWIKTFNKDRIYLLQPPPRPSIPDPPLPDLSNWPYLPNLPPDLPSLPGFPPLPPLPPLPNLPPLPPLPSFPTTPDFSRYKNPVKSTIQLPPPNILLGVIGRLYEVPVKNPIRPDPPIASSPSSSTVPGALSGSGDTPDETTFVAESAEVDDGSSNTVQIPTSQPPQNSTKRLGSVLFDAANILLQLQFANPFNQTSDLLSPSNSTQQTLGMGSRGQESLNLDHSELLNEQRNQQVLMKQRATQPSTNTTAKAELTINSDANTLSNYKEHLLYHFHSMLILGNFLYIPSSLSQSHPQAPQPEPNDQPNGNLGASTTTTTTTTTTGLNKEHQGQTSNPNTRVQNKNRFAFDPPPFADFPESRINEGLSENFHPFEAELLKQHKYATFHRKSKSHRKAEKVQQLDQLRQNVSTLLNSSETDPFSLTDIPDSVKNCNIGEVYPDTTLAYDYDARKIRVLKKSTVHRPTTTFSGSIHNNHYNKYRGQVNSLKLDEPQSKLDLEIQQATALAIGLDFHDHLNRSKAIPNPAQPQSRLLHHSDRSDHSPHSFSAGQQRDLYHSEQHELDLPRFTHHQLMQNVLGKYDFSQHDRFATLSTTASKPSPRAARKSHNQPFSTFSHGNTPDGGTTNQNLDHQDDYDQQSPARQESFSTSVHSFDDLTEVISAHLQYHAASILRLERFQKESLRLHTFSLEDDPQLFSNSTLTLPQLQQIEQLQRWFNVFQSTVTTPPITVETPISTSTSSRPCVLSADPTSSRVICAEPTDQPVCPAFPSSSAASAMSTLSQTNPTKRFRTQQASPGDPSTPPTPNNNNPAMWGLSRPSAIGLGTVGASFWVSESMTNMNYDMDYASVNTYPYSIIQLTMRNFTPFEQFTSVKAAKRIFMTVVFRWAVGVEPIFTILFDSLPAISLAPLAPLVNTIVDPLRDIVNSLNLPGMTDIGQFNPNTTISFTQLTVSVPFQWAGVRTHTEDSEYVSSYSITAPPGTQLIGRSIAMVGRTSVPFSVEVTRSVSIPAGVFGSTTGQLIEYHYSIPGVYEGANLLNSEYIVDTL